MVRPPSSRSPRPAFEVDDPHRVTCMTANLEPGRDGYPEKHFPSVYARGHQLGFPDGWDVMEVPVDGPPAVIMFDY